MSTALEVSVYVSWALLIVLAYAVFVLYRHFGQLYVSSPAGRADQGPGVGEALLSISLTDVAGGAVTLPSKKATVLLFADIDCELCSEIRDQSDALDPFADRVQAVVFCAGSLADVKAWSSRTRDYIHVVWDERMAAANRYRVNTLPFAVAVGSSGVVHAKSIINGRDGLVWAAEQAIELPVVDSSRTSSEVVVQP